MQSPTHLDADQLIALLRAETARRQPEMPQPEGRFHLDSFPGMTWWTSVEAKTERVNHLLSRAQRTNAGSRRLPKFLRGLFRKQGGYNRHLVESVATLTAQVEELRKALQAQNQWLQDLPGRLREQFRQIQSAATRTSEELSEEKWNLLNLTEDVSSMRARGETLQQETTHLAAELARMEGTVGRELSTVNETVAQLETTTSNASVSAAAALAQLERCVLSDVIFMKGQLVRIAGQLASREPSPRARNPASAAARKLQRETEPDLDHSLDEFYLAFENEFRGDRSAIKERLKVYLPFLETAGITGVRGGLLDLGCGRGEWLELLREQKIDQAMGVDLNTAMVVQCAGRGLNVIEADALSHLRSIPENSLEAITSFHLIEHLHFRTLLELLGHVQRTLRPDGLLILETPNPRNILVGASDFFRDITHNHPVHPDTLRFTLETIGFAEVRCYFLQDEPEERRAIPMENFQFSDLQSYVDVPRDYAVLARKA